MDTVTHALLHDIVRHEGRSLLQYISEAYPWTSAREQDALARMQRMVAEEQEGAVRLTNLLRKKRVNPPYLGAYPMTFTNLNYVSLEHLLPLLIEYQKERIDDLEAYVSRIADADAAAVVRQILDCKRRHLQTLVDMNAPNPAAA